MKRNSFKKLAITVVLGAAMAAYMVACKKDLVTPINNEMPDDIPGYCVEARDVVRRINSFDRRIADKEVARSSERMPLDSVVWNIESLFNVSYTFPERKYVETIKQQLEFNVDVDQNLTVAMGDVAALYDEVVAAVRQAYANDGITADKSLMAVVVDKGETQSGTAVIKVHVISGRVAHEVVAAASTGGPFGPGDAWYYGEYGGTCDDPSVWGDAAEIIEDTINYYWGGTSVPKTGFRNLNVNMTGIILDGNEFFDENGLPYLYFYGLYDNPPLCLNDSLLNHYYYNELEVLLHLVPTSPYYQPLMPPQPSFLNVDIIGMMNYVGNTSCLQHKNYVIYCSRWAVPEDELKPADEMLY